MEVFKYTFFSPKFELEPKCFIVSCMNDSANAGTIPASKMVSARKIIHAFFPYILLRTRAYI